MGSEALQEKDFRSRYDYFQGLDNGRNTLVKEILDKLDTVTAQLDTATEEKARDVSTLTADLENEKEARRRWQNEATALRERVFAMEQARFVLVLIDADADIYLFHEKYLSRGLAGGQDAADHFMEKVRDHLVSLPSINEPKSVPVMVKAFANLSGLAQACVRDKKVKFVGDVNQFWIGFIRRYALVDFVDVGPGKEEADNKIREVLGFHLSNLQCEHIMLACCHDSGYVPVLRQYAAQSSHSERITLLSASPVPSDIRALGFRSTSAFEPLFCSPRVLQPTTNTIGHQPPLDNMQYILDVITSEASSQTIETPVNNSGRLRPILRNGAGKRIDKDLNVDVSLFQEIKKHNLCNRHYLRADCQVTSCKRNHMYPRPLSPEEYDAQ